MKTSNTTEKEKRSIRERLKQFRPSLYFTTIGSVLLIMLVFAFLVQSIGYYAFTRSFEKEYSDSSLRIARYGNELIGYTDITRFLNYTPEELELITQFGSYSDYEIYCMNHDMDIDRKYYLDGLDYEIDKINLQDLCNAMGMSVIYVVKPNEDFTKYTCIFNCVNDDSGYDPWPMGKEVEITNDYKEPFKRIMSGQSQQEIVSRYDNLGGGKPHFTAIVPITDKEGNVDSILCVQRFADGLTMIRKYFIQGVTALEIILIIIIILLESKLLRISVIKPVGEISMEAGRFAKENTKAEVGLADRNYQIREIVELARSLDKMEEDTIKNMENITSMAVEQERIGADLTLASKIQIGMLPLKHQLLEDYTEFDIHATMTPAKEVGGDFYDFYMIDDDHLVIEIADVSDKGMGAAFFMAISKTLLKSRAGMGGKPTDIIAYVDKMISEKNVAGMFVTVWFAIIDLTTGHVDVCNAGHDYPAVSLKGQDYVIEKTPHGPPVAFLPGVPFVGTEFDMEPGDRIFLYTDGLNEAKRSDGERFGIERMLTVLNNHKNASNEELIATMKDTVRMFMGDEPQFDDMTMLSFTFNKRK